MVEFNLKFLQSGASLSDLPQDDIPEIAIIGRSNSGKSSTLNSLVKNGGSSLARTSKTPGRTRLINLFGTDTWRLVDLPGYGYAKMDKKTAVLCGEMLDQYLSKRRNLVGILQIMDIRHPLQPVDTELFTFLDRSIPHLICLNKSDKISKSRGKQTQLAVVKKLADYGVADGSGSQVITYSAATAVGVSQLHNFIISMIGS